MTLGSCMLADSPVVAAPDHSSAAGGHDELRRAGDLVESFSGGEVIAAADASDLASVVADLRRLERLLAVVGVQVTGRSAALAEGADGPGPIETLLSTGGDVSGRQARREAARADLISWWPEIGQALTAGTISPAVVDALARQTERLNDEQRHQLPRIALLGDAKRLPVDTFTRVVGRVIANIENSGPGVVDKRARSSFHHWFDDAIGMGRFTGTLDPERYEAFTTAIEQHLATLATADGRGAVRGPVLAAAALYELTIGSGARSRHLPHITVVVGPTGEAETGDGQPLTPNAARRLSCDAVLQRVIVDDKGLPLNVSRRYRTATAAQWAAIRAMYRTCAWAGCRQPISRCQLHHLLHWRHGGPTDLDNLVPLCSHHHHLVHEGGWQLHLYADRSMRITTPDGRRHTTAASPCRCDHPVASGPAP